MMRMTARHLPWMLGSVGAILGCFGFILPFAAAAFFTAGVVHVRRPLHEHGKLLRAAITILISAFGFGLSLGVMEFFWSKGDTSCVELISQSLATALRGLPSALLLVYACASRTAPRPESLLRGADHAAEALAVLAAVIVLPWWCSAHPRDMAWILFLVALPSVAIGLQALVSARQMKALRSVFSAGHVAYTMPNAELSLDVGFGGTLRALPLGKAQSYRQSTREGVAVLVGDPERAAQSALRLAQGAAAVLALAAIHIAFLLAL